MARKCAECPAETVKVCRHAFGRLWNDKSNNGQGCDSPMDHVAAAWKSAGWKGETVPLSLPKAPVRPKRPVANAGQVSERIRKQAELFFGRAAK